MEEATKYVCLALFFSQSLDLGAKEVMRQWQRRYFRCFFCHLK